MVDFLGPRGGRTESAISRPIFSSASRRRCCRAARKRPRVNPSLLREMWRAAASLELLPIQTKTQLGDELVARIKKGDFVDTGLWCLARLGARKLFYGPINQVLPASTATRWMEALLENPEGGGRGGRHGAPHRRRDARSAGADARCRAPRVSGASISTPNRRISSRPWAKSSAKNCPPGSCSMNELDLDSSASASYAPGVRNSSSASATIARSIARAPARICSSRPTR